MTYYKQFNSWKYVYVFAIAIGAVCLYLAYSGTGLDSRVIFLSCGLVCLIAGWVMRKGQAHYLKIDDEKIIHQGFRKWTIRKSDVTRIEGGKKGWLDDNELYLRIYADKAAYDIDDGFLTDDEHVQELATAISSRRT